MTTGLDIRESSPNDREALERLYPQAFPDEDLVPLLRDLLNARKDVLSLVAVRDGEVVGHVAFTMCGIDELNAKIGLLGPVAVSPRFQKQGIGSALIRQGLKRMKSGGALQVQVLGDPAYYGRFGFAADDSVAPPYALPEEWRTAWQSIRLEGPERNLEGTLSVPEPWRQAALWGP